MIIKVLIGQRICDYEKEYAPEVIDAVDEYTDDVNPVYLLDKWDEAEKTGGYSTIRVFDIEIDDEIVAEALKPEIHIDGNMIKIHEK